MKELTEAGADASPNLVSVRALDELLAITDPGEFRAAVVEHVCAKYRVHGWESITPFEWTIFHAWDCEYRILEGKLLDEAILGEQRCAMLVAVLEEIGARRAADALRRTYALYAAVPPELAAAARTLGDWLDLVGEDRIFAIQDSLDEHEVGERIQAFVNQNRHRLRPD